MKNDFKEIVNCIFIKKEKYKFITDKEKEDSFYIINKKFSIKYPNLAAVLNNKDIDKASAIDIWFYHFKNINYIPNWYWSKTTFKKDKKTKISKSDIESLMLENELSENEFDFLYENYKDEIDFEIKMLKRWK